MPTKLDGGGELDTPKYISTLHRKMAASVNTRLTPMGLSGAKAMFPLCLYDHQRISQVEICRDLEGD